MKTTAERPAPGEMKWTRKPRECSVGPERAEITTEPHTDLWQRTYYHFRNDNAPLLQWETEERFFSFVVKTDFSDSHHRFDQCGIVLYLDSENWLKASVEYENEAFQHLGSVVTNHGYSDWATTAIPAEIKSMWYRLSRRGGRSASAFTRAVPRIPASGRFLRTWRSQAVPGRRMTGSPPTDRSVLSPGFDPFGPGCRPPATISVHRL